MKKDLLFIAFPDFEDDESLVFFDIPKEDPDEEHWLFVSKIYQFAEQKAKKQNIKCLIYQYEVVNGRLVNGIFKKRM